MSLIQLRKMAEQVLQIFKSAEELYYISVQHGQYPKAQEQFKKFDDLITEASPDLARGVIQLLDEREKMLDVIKMAKHLMEDMRIHPDADMPLTRALKELEGGRWIT